MLKTNPHLCHIQVLHLARIDWLHLSLHALIHILCLRNISQVVEIDCINAVDYSIRPPSPGLLEGGPFIKFYEQHPTLDSVSRYVPNTDCEQAWHESVKFSMLAIDQSFIIAQRFEIQINYGNDTGLVDAHKQASQEARKSFIDWLEPFRLPANRPAGSDRIRQ